MQPRVQSYIRWGRADESFAVRQAMNHDRAAGRSSEPGGAPSVIGIGVRDVERLVVGAGCIPRIDDVVTLRGACVALALLRRQSARTERNLVGANHFAFGEELHAVSFFEDQDGVGLFGRRGLGRCKRGDDREREERDQEPSQQSLR